MTRLWGKVSAPHILADALPRRARVWVSLTLLVGTLSVLLFVLPLLLSAVLANASQGSGTRDAFPVTVDPQQKTITESATVNQYLEQRGSPLRISAAHQISSVAGQIFRSLSLALVSAPWYQLLAAADTRFVSIEPGVRKEQVASAFGKVLGWTDEQISEFLRAPLPFDEGSFLAGVYRVSGTTSVRDVQALVNTRFATEVLARYSTEVAQKVPLRDALTIASLIEREAGGPADMRLISGIIWNRLFINMPLQIDATVQYAKANSTGGAVWWPKVLPVDLRRDSPFNTYAHKGLPPAPIASPSVAAILAALNPRETPCLFYFHDSLRQFHCSETYAGHVTLLKQYFGQGK